MKSIDVDLNEYHLTKNGVYRNKLGKKYIEAGPCKQCGDMFLKQPCSKGEFCCKSCKASYENVNNGRIYPTGKNHPCYGVPNLGSSNWMKLNNPGKPGNLNPNWRGGGKRNEGSHFYYRTDDWKKWRAKVFERDNYTCALCGQHGNKLEPHHIKRFSLYPDIRFDENNGITLCKKCHQSKVNHKEQEYEEKFIIYIDGLKTLTQA